MNIKLLLILALPLLFASCTKEAKVDMLTFRKGNFEIPAGDKYDKTTFVRIDNYQIETYNGKVDTLKIQWKDNFNYTLKMLHPKSDLDKEPINVRITKVSGTTYEFEAIVGHSNFVQKGTVVKLKD